MLLFLVLLSSPWSSSSASAPPPLQVPANYNKAFHPPETPFSVVVNFDVVDVAKVDVASHSMTLKMLVSLRWDDSRVRANVTQWTRLDPEVKDRLWLPKLHSRSMHVFRPLSVGPETQEKLLVSPKSDSRLYYETLSLVTFGCTMDFSDFPFDSHSCHFKTHLDYPKEVAVLRLWPHFTSSAASFSPEAGREFHFEISQLPEEENEECGEEVIGGREIYQQRNKGCQSVAGFEMRFSRQSRSYLGQYYAPSGLIVAASWTSFVIPPDSIPARVMLLITTFLILINVSNTAFANSPVSSSVNPIQIWILGCLAFVLLTVVEYASILCYQRYVIRKTMVTRREIARQGLCLRPMKNDMVGITENSMLIMLSQIDLACLIGSVILFLVFNGVYWGSLKLFT